MTDSSVLNLRFRPAVGSDLNVLLAVLDEEGLVTEDVSPHIAHYFVVTTADQMAGFGGFEIHDEFALLRSVVVLPQFRKQGVAKELCAYLEQQMWQHECTQSYLLTNTSAAAFTHLGYAEIERSEVPAQIKASQQFSSLCPDSATVMVKPLGDDSA